MNYYLNLLKEAIIIGISLCINFIFLNKLLSGYFGSLFYLILVFLSGFLLHIIFDLTTLNKWYCTNYENAAFNLRDDFTVSAGALMGPPQPGRCAGWPNRGCYYARGEVRDGIELCTDNHYQRCYDEWAEEENRRERAKIYGSPRGGGGGHWTDDIPSPRDYD